VTNAGCTWVLVAFWVVMGAAWLLQRNDGPPPMTQAESRALISKMKAERTQRCIDNISKGYQYWPKDMQKYAGPAMAKCGDDD
jgi:hypothetical protein